MKTVKYTPANDSDELNEQYLFSTTATDLLVAIVHGQIDANKSALLELQKRGLNESGKWVGFKKEI